MSGQSISVTIPKPLVGDLQEAANMIGISRSRYITNILLKWQETRKRKASKEQDLFETVVNTCPNREDDGFCKVFEHVCNAPQSEAISCVGYPKDTNRGK